MLTRPFDRLNDRELEIILLAAQGLSNQQAGDACYLSVNTIKTYIRQILDKTNSQNKAEAVAVLMLDERFRSLHVERSMSSR